MPHRIIPSIEGRRGGVLTIIAAMFLTLGGYHVSRPSGARSLALSWLPTWFDHSALGWAMVVLAGVALVCALTSRWWKKLALAIGFRCCMAVSASLTYIYAVAFFSGVEPSASYSAILFLGFTLLILEISVWDNRWGRAHRELPPQMPTPTQPPGDV